MITNRQGAALILQNFQLFEQATKLMAEIDREVIKEIDVVIDSRLRETKWLGNVDSLEEDSWIVPPQWNNKGSKPERRADCDAYFSLSFGEGDEEEDEDDYWWVTRLCGVGRGSMGFRWRPNEDTYGIKNDRRGWKSFIADKKQQLERFGFYHEEGKGYFFLPIRLDHLALANAIQQEVIADALGPVNEALSKIEKSVPEFARILDERRVSLGKGRVSKRA